MLETLKWCSHYSNMPRWHSIAMDVFNNAGHRWAECGTHSVIKVFVFIEATELKHLLFSQIDLSIFNYFLIDPGHVVISINDAMYWDRDTWSMPKAELRVEVRIRGRVGEYCWIVFGHIDFPVSRLYIKYQRRL